MDILEIYEDYKRGVKPAGPMASELEAEFDNIRVAIGDFRGKVVDERRREKMLEHLRIRLHPGLLADCFFEPKDAACLGHLEDKDRKQPVVGICDPHCSNACWLKKHLSVWEGGLADVQRLANRNRISPIQRQILRGNSISITSRSNWLINPFQRNPSRARLQEITPLKSPVLCLRAWRTHLPSPAGAAGGRSFPAAWKGCLRSRPQAHFRLESHKSLK